MPLNLPSFEYRKIITDHFSRSSAFKEFLESRGDGKRGMKSSLSGLLFTAKVLFLGCYFRELLNSSKKIDSQTLVYIATTDREAVQLYEDLKFFFPNLKSVYRYPSLSELPGKLTPLPTEECHARHRLIHYFYNSRYSFEDSHTLIITSLKATLEKIPSPQSPDLISKKVIRVGSTDSLMNWGENLEKLGYRRTHEVVSPGEYAIRNAILDVYSPQEAHPHRVYFWDEEVEMIKPFNIHTQKVLASDVFKEKILSITLPENRLSDYHTHDDGTRIVEMFSGKRGEDMVNFWHSHQEFSWALLEPFLDDGRWEWISFRDLLPNPILILDEENLSSNSTTFQNFIEPYRRPREWDTDSLFASPEKRFLPPHDLERHSLIRILRHPSTEEGHIHFPIRKAMGFKKDLNKCREYLHKESQIKKVYLFTSNPVSGKKLMDFFKPLNPFLIDEQGFIIDGDIQGCFPIICHSISEGLDGIEQLLITDFELFRKKSKVVIKGSGITEVLEYFTELREGDHVVHINQGIGKYLGLERIKGEGIEKDYLKIRYQGGDHLYVPVEQMNLVQRYIGNKGQAPRLDFLGGKSWDRIKQRVKKQLEDITRELINLYQERRDYKKLPCNPDDYFQELFESGFPFQETEDQLRATEEIKKDLESDTVMDRLLCGDVGFGKTEVAMRAIFKAIFSGRQTAVLVPTTILSLQHYQRFIERFQDFPVTIRVLNRFKDRLEREAIIKETEEGKVEILIGTHALLSKKISFKKLGLLVVDEEQKFGVKQKEKIKKNYPHVDTLSLSATPIPRTLHLSLSSIRSLSTLNIPPQNRHAVKTYVLKWDISVIREATLKEMRRQGQVFFVHNQVSSLATIANLLSQEIPEIKIRIAHGQMVGRDLEQVMDDFVHHRFDMLVSTSIIESGMDLSRVNTLMVNNADHFGLTQLYQLRGRVGRSDREAYAYFFLPPDRIIGEDAMKRLDALTTYTELGAGFKIAMSDLEIRGPGNILGSEQSGNIMAIGFELYTRLLNESIQESLRKREGDEKKSDFFLGTLLELKYEGFIPHNYIPEDRQKIAVYKRIAAIETLEGIDRVRGEIESQYGKIIPIIERLLQIAEIRVYANRARIFSIREREGYYAITLFSESRVNRKTLLQGIIDNILLAIPEEPEQFRLPTTDLKQDRLFTFEERIKKLRELLIVLIDEG